MVSQKVRHPSDTYHKSQSQSQNTLTYHKNIPPIFKRFPEQLEPLLPSDSGFDRSLLTTWRRSRKFNVIRYFTELYAKYPRRWLMTEFVESVKLYCQHCEELQKLDNLERKTTWICSYTKACCPRFGHHSKKWVHPESCSCF